MAKQGYTVPKLYNYDGDLKKEWYAGFRHTDPATGIRKPFQIRLGINFHKDISGRTLEGAAVVKLTTDALNAGWNPHAEDIKDFILRSTHATTHITQMPLNAALDYAYNSKLSTLAKKSKSDIGGVKEFAKQAAVKLSIHAMPIIEVERQHIKMLLEQIGKDRQQAYIADRAARYSKLLKKYKDPRIANEKAGSVKQWTGNSYNKYRQFLQILFTELEEYNAIKFNPCLKIAAKPEIKTNIYRHATEKEERLIKGTLRREKPNFFIYLAFEYLTGIRPKELFGIQVCEIDWFNQCIDIQATDGKSKTRSARKVPIPNALLPYLESMELEKAQPNDYIFSTDFKYGPLRKKRDYATKWWKKLVIDGLGLAVKLYSFKGKGGEAKRKAGIEAGTVSGQFGHANMNMTKIYLHGEQDRMNQEIREKTPNF